MSRRLPVIVLLTMLAVLVLAACGGQVQEAAPTIAAAVEEIAPTVQAAVEEAAPAEEVMDEGSIWVLLPDSATSARWETDDRRFFEEAFEAPASNTTLSTPKATPAPSRPRPNKRSPPGPKSSCW